MMSTRVTLEIPEDIERDAREVAERTHQRIEDVLTDWLGRGAAELPVDALPDERVLELCDMQMPSTQQQELSDLLALNRENSLTGKDVAQLDQLMQIYRRGLIRKAEALKVAAQRGLRPPLN
jgi:hypothetical protein